MIISLFQSFGFLKKFQTSNALEIKEESKPSTHPDPKRPHQHKLALDPILNKIISLLLLSSIVALTGSYISQYIFDLKPCILCFYQRKPFFAILALTSLSIVFFKVINTKKIIILLCTLLLLINALIAIYHVGVERKIFQGPTTCSSIELNNINDLEALKAALLKTKAVRCDKPSFVFLGISMAGWNIIYCLGLLSFIISIYRKNNKSIAS